MKAKNIILGAATLAAFSWLLTRKKESKVGKLATGQQFVRRGSDLAELFRTGRKGSLNNGDIVFDFDTARISENIRKAAAAESVSLPAETDNLRDIRKAYKYSKREDGGAFWQTTGRLGFNRDRNGFIYYILGWLGVPDEGEAVTERDGYLLTLKQTAVGGKWLWSGRGKNKLGIREQVLASKGNTPEEKRIYKSICEAGGDSPEEYAESITKYGADTYPVLQGVIGALKDAPTRNAAYDLLRGIWERYNKMNDQQKDDDKLPF